MKREPLPNEVLEPGYLRQVSVDTDRKWLHELDLSVLDQKNRVYIDGHERVDVVEYRKQIYSEIHCSWVYQHILKHCNDKQNIQYFNFQPVNQYKKF